MSKFRPMKGDKADLSKLTFPLWVSPKLDGVRAVVIDGVVLSSTLKPIPNRHVQEKFGHLEFFDGELIYGEPTADDVYNKTVSAVMTREGPSDVDFYVFDHFKHTDLPFYKRVGLINHSTTVPYYIASDLDDLNNLERHLVTELGYEGVMVRRGEGHYKFGRSTVKEGLLLKLKRFQDAEFAVIGFVEQMHNANEATIDNLGRSARSSHKANKVPKDTLGALICQYGDSTFEVGTGFSDDQRKHIWQNRGIYLGAMAKVKYFAVGMKDLPRHPVFLGFRNEIDLDFGS